MIHLKSAFEINQIAAAGHILADVLSVLEEQIRPGITTADLDKIAREKISKAGAQPSFLGYGQPPFPAAICASIDAEVVHGIPNSKRTLEEGSILSVDVGVYLNGYHADAARTFAVGTIAPESTQLVEVTRTCFWEAIRLAVPGNRLGDLSAAVQTCAEQHGYGVVRELTGHGIGKNLHEEPDLPNYGRSGHGLRLEPGMVLAMEPMINMGTRRIMMLEDGWTIVTADGKPSAHYENTFAITEKGPLILTLQAGESEHGR
ncbi:MAG: type I methionyl aminopeptidase [Ruminococcaceae bacterium]|nr:type I methionyl aminopeptidase [Oscillospiraceae bacterium]